MIPPTLSFLDITIVWLIQPRFLLTTLQVDELLRCHNEFDVDETLSSLPRLLSDMYDRILEKISGHKRQQYATAILMWTTFTRRPLCVQEIEWATSFTFGDDSEMTVDPKRRMQNGKEEIFSICDSLVGLIDGADEDACYINGSQMIQLAHSTVKQKEAIRQGVYGSANFKMNQPTE